MLLSCRCCLSCRTCCSVSLAYAAVLLILLSYRGRFCPVASAVRPHTANAALLKLSVFRHPSLHHMRSKLASRTRFDACIKRRYSTFENIRGRANDDKTDED